jgi:hypothetical protein
LAVSEPRQGLKDPLAVGRGDPGAAIGHAEPYAVVVDFDPDRGRHSGRVVGCVFEHVADGGEEEVLVTFHQSVVGNGTGEHRSAGVVAARPAQEGGKGNRVTWRGSRRLGGAAEVQQAQDQFLEPIDIGQRLFRGGAILGGVAVPPQRHLDRGPQLGQQRPQFMRRAGSEPVLARDPLGQAVEHTHGQTPVPASVDSGRTPS